MSSTDFTIRHKWYPWYVVLLLSLAYLFSFVDRVIISLLIIPIQQDLHISDFEISLVVGIGFALFYTVFGLPIGRMVDVYNRRNIIIVGIITWSLATAACGLATGFLFLFFVRVIVAIGEATLSPSAYSIIMDYVPPQRSATALSIYGMGMFIGAGAALMLGGIVISSVANHPSFTLPLFGELRTWQAVFIIVGLPGLFMAALFLTVKEPTRRGLLTKSDTKHHAVPVREIANHFRLNWQAFSYIIMAYALTSLFGYGLHAWAPTFLIRTYGWNLSDVGLIYGAVILLSGLLGVVLGGLTADRMQRRGIIDSKIVVLIIGYGLMMPCAVAAPLMPTSWLAVLLLGIMNFGFSFPAGCGTAALMSITPNQMRGQISAVYLLVLNIIGLGLGPSSIAFITDYVFADKQALRYSLSIVAIAVLPVAVLLTVLARKYYKQSLGRAAAWLQ